MQPKKTYHVGWMLFALVSLLCIPPVAGHFLMHSTPGETLHAEIK